MSYMKPNYEYSEETKSGFNTWTASVDFEVLKIERKATMINWQLRSYTDSHDHTSTVTVMLPDLLHAVTIIAQTSK